MRYFSWVLGLLAGAFAVLNAMRLELALRKGAPHGSRTAERRAWWNACMASYPAELEEQWEAGGDLIRIRPVRREDAAEHKAFFHRLSSEDLRLRFLATVRELSPALLAKLTQTKRSWAHTARHSCDHCQR